MKVRNRKFKTKRGGEKEGKEQNWGRELFKDNYVQREISLFTICKNANYYNHIHLNSFENFLNSISDTSPVLMSLSFLYPSIIYSFQSYQTAEIPGNVLKGLVEQK